MEAEAVVEILPPLMPVRACQGGGTTGDVTLGVNNLGITNAMLADNAVNSAKIQNGSVDISSDTNLTAGTNISLSGDTLNVDDAFVLNTGDNMSGQLSVTASVSYDGVVYAENTNINGYGVYGRASNIGTGTNYGGYFIALGSDGRGVYGNTTGTNGRGVYGRASGGSGRGVYGYATSAADYGGYFEADGNFSTAVYGTADASDVTYQNYGGDFISAGRYGRGVRGTASGEDGRGVYGYASGASGRGVWGQASHGSGSNYGGRFETSSPNGHSGYFTGGDFEVRLGPTSNNFIITSLPIGTGNDIQINGNNLVRIASSRRYKEDIKELKVETAKVLDLQPVSFKYKETGQEDIGLIAEDVNELIPDLVIYNEEGQPDSVKYDRVPVYLLEVIKEQQEKINNQESDIKELKSALCEEFPGKEVCR